MKNQAKLLVLNRVIHVLVTNLCMLPASNHVLVIRKKILVTKNVRVPQKILQFLPTTISITIISVVHYLHLIVAAIGEKIIVPVMTISNK
ncbi:hypothetical protein [Peribacillus loiseleuriae]|uniref:hypothetical protein n=1 Tax=Peribacillus loiseleuriae TaxID=1679170 RepID=UPI003CFBCFD8